MVPPPDWLLILGLLAVLLIVLRGRGRLLRNAGGRWPLYVALWLAIIVTLGLIYQYVWTPTF